MYGYRCDERLKTSIKESLCFRSCTKQTGNPFSTKRTVHLPRTHPPYTHVLTLLPMITLLVITYTHVQVFFSEPYHPLGTFGETYDLKCFLHHCSFHTVTHPTITLLYITCTQVHGFFSQPHLPLDTF